MDVNPRLAYPGRKAMPAVEKPSRNSAIVSLVSRPRRRWMRMNKTVPMGRAMKAKENMVNA